MSKVTKQTPVFDPTKNYRWEPSDTFKLTGQEFASIYHLISQEWSVPEGAPLSLKAEVHGVVMSIFGREVAKGLIIETDLGPNISKEDENKVRQLFNK